MPRKKNTLSEVVEMKAQQVIGTPISEIAKEFNQSTRIVQRKLDTFSTVLNSKNELLSGEGQILKEKLSDKLEIFKNELTNKAIDVIKKADTITLNRLENLKTTAKDAAQISEIYTKRLSGLTNMEDLNPDKDEKENTQINIYINEMINRVCPPKRNQA